MKFEFSLLSSTFQGAKAIAEMLKKNSTLRVVELNNNLIDYSVCNYYMLYFLLPGIILRAKV